MCVHVTVSRIFLVPSGHIKHLSSYFPLGDLCFCMLILSGFADACLLTECFFLFQELELDKFVTHEVNFEDINKAFDLLLEGKSLRCVIWMDKQASKSEGVCTS